MRSLRITFARACIGSSLSFTFWFAVWAIAIDDEQQKREKQRQKKRILTPKAPRHF